MSIPHLQMPLPVVYPINAVSYDAAAVAAKKGKQSMERAQREAEEAKLAPKRMNYAERKAMQQEIMDAMVEEDFRGKEMARRRRNAFEVMPALENIDDHFATSGQVQRYLQMRAGELKPYMQASEDERGMRRDAREAELMNTSSIRSLTTTVKTKRTKSVLLTPLRKLGLAQAEKAPVQATDGTNYDRMRRRNSFAKLPGFQEKPKSASAVDEELEEARENGGLVRSFCIADNHFECHHNSINTCAFSNDERRVASCSTDGQIRLWDLKSGRLVKTMLGHTESVMTVAFSDEGQVCKTPSWHHEPNSPCLTAAVTTQPPPPSASHICWSREQHLGVEYLVRRAIAPILWPRRRNLPGRVHQ
mmetsp:Transcript_68011/g.188045  ORF Transcript_68011/g.188045 Transcript_68011/m.188045 type:complete len:361 (-) Transcript_68011:1677-2759(-)